ncbi:ABC transporter substrate-binding protein [Paenibacillus protaetiae]|uniref:ABC transporter substrate-binding protein n=1 Tax=Paenibacillus protaetiae TaxID=2509456 RepID=A0A4P6F2C3_9BACL|nr:ABC transporter substrate-binding protein [Paenibacillus protaetiae]QAY67227.1 ABC transporter substrate-binding protein [Paenibacillus protaetiae]
MKRKYWGTSALLALTVATAACGNNSGSGSPSGAAEAATAKPAAESTASADKPVTLKFYSYNLAIASQVPGTQKLIDEFEAAHPNIKIDAVPVASTDINAKVQADIVAGSAPDIAQLTFDGLDFAVHNFNAKPLEDIVPADEFKSNFEGFSPNGLKLGQLDGKTYGLPFTFSTPVLFYNAKLFEDAGLDPNQPPATWADVKKDALAIAQKTGASGVHIGGAVGGDWIIQALIGSNGGQALSDDRKTIKFGEPEAIGAVQMWQDMIASGANDKMNDSEVIEAFSQGKVGMLLYTSALQSSLLAAAKAGNWELKAAKMPSFDGKPTTPVNSGSALFILSDDKAKQQAAWEFLKFATSERGYTIITSEIGYLPLRPAIVDDPQYLKDWVTANPLVKPNLEQLDSLKPWVSYPGSNWKQIETILNDAVSKAIMSNGDVTSIMQDAQKRAQSLMP